MIGRKLTKKENEASSELLVTNTVDMQIKTAHYVKLHFCN